MSIVSAPGVVVLFATGVAISIVPKRAIPGTLLLASSAFYVASAPGGAWWLAVSILLTYGVGRWLPVMAPNRATWVLTAAVAALMGALVLVKLPGLAIAAPLGISYFSFRLVAYMVDVYWGRCPPARSPAGFAAYVSFFPQITSGPIDRWEHFLGQLKEPGYPSYERMSSALRLILFGLFKKLVVANRLGYLVDPVFDSPAGVSAPYLVAAAYAFPVQLYADFSGLTDIARGASRLLGIEAPRNFDHPFLSTSVQEFWSRWHMSLTYWLRDYLFKPLSATLRRRGRAGLVIAISVNMIAIGLWHGVQWTFLAFGLLNAIYLAWAAIFRRPLVMAEGHASAGGGWRRWARRAATYNLMMLSFVFFRATDVSSALDVLGGFRSLFDASGRSLDSVTPVLDVRPAGLFVPVAVMALIEFAVAQGYWDRWFVRPKWGAAARWAAYYVTVAAILVFGVLDNTKFIYARF